MRYSFGFMCVCAFAIMPLIGCSDAEPKCETAADCNDQGDCTVDTCEPSSGACSHTPTADGASCDFSGAPGVCMSGVCEADLCAEVDCDDDNDCTHDPCDPVDGTCSNTPILDGTVCDFGGFPGVCRMAICEDAMLCENVDCDDLNDCTDDACEPGDGMCEHTPLEDGTACDDGAGTCNGGFCGSCTGAADTDVYSNLTYVNDDGVTSTGSDAATAIGFDCLLGSTNSMPPVVGCTDQYADVIVCFPVCPDDTIAALATCVADCTQGTTAEIAPPGLSDECIACTGDAAACGVAFCISSCAADFSSAQCIACRCDTGCTQSFATCSGIPSNECD